MVEEHGETGNGETGNGTGIVAVVAYDPFRGRELVLFDGIEEIGRIPLADWMTRFLIDSLQRTLSLDARH
jgi:hypothetical protein